MFFRCRVWSQRRRSRRTPPVVRCVAERLDVRCLLSASSLSVAPNLFGLGRDGLLVGNQPQNRVTVQVSNAFRTGFDMVASLGANNVSQQSPGDVEWFQLDRAASFPNAVVFPNAIVVSTGGNAVIVNHTTMTTGGGMIFDADPQTYFVGTAPASVTVADINNDFIPDLLVANQGSNDISILFGSYGSNGEWLGMAGPRLQSGGAGPIGVAVRDLNSDSNPDLVVTNGTSGTVTSLVGLGNGVFDDLHPQTLFNLGGMVDQPPTFVDATGVGFAVTTTGVLVRFDLSNPSNGAAVVFSSSPVAAAQALPNGQGQVVVAITNGTVEVLRPRLGQLVVSRELFPLAGTPDFPSSLVVVQQDDGQLQVLVSSRGLDTVSVFSDRFSAPPDGVVAIRSGSSFLLIESTARSLGFDLLSGGGANDSLSGTPIRFLRFNSNGDIPNSTMGLSLSSVTSSTNLEQTPYEEMFRQAISRPAIVSIRGSAYSAVAVLGFGSQQGDEESGDGRSRLLRIPPRYPVSDLLPLARYLIGLDDAFERYRSHADDSRHTDEGEAPQKDLWKEHFFHRPRAAQPPIRHQKETPGPASEKPKEKNDPQAKPLNSEDNLKSKEQALLDSFWRQCPSVDPPSLFPQASAGGGSNGEILAALLASVISCDRAPDQGTSRDRRRPRISQPQECGSR